MNPPKSDRQVKANSCEKDQKGGAPDPILNTQKAGFDEHLVKPVDLLTLKRILGGGEEIKG